MNLLTELWEEAALPGYAIRSFHGSPEKMAGALQLDAELAGWAPAPERGGRRGPVVLRPSEADNAQPRSLSRLVGLGAQPLHTDGAHLERVPDVTVLFAQAPSGTPTMVFRPELEFGYSDEARLGVFTVRSAGTAKLHHSYDNGWRFDPGCMTPCDARAALVVSEFQSAESRAKEVSWDESGLILLLRNREVLHARGSIVEGDDNREIMRLSYYREKK